MISIQIKIGLLEFLILLNVLFFLLFILLLHGNSNFSYLIYLLSLHTELVLEGFWFQFITFNFVHLQIFHILFNLLGLYNIGNIVQHFYNGKKLFLVYILGGITAGITTFLASVFTMQPIVTVGASGSIFAMCGLLLGGLLRRNRFGVDIPLNLQSFLFYIVIAILIGFVPGFNINNWAHLGGLSFGVLTGFVIDNNLSVESKFSKIMTNILFFLSLLLLIISFAFCFYFVFFYN